MRLPSFTLPRLLPSSVGDGLASLAGRLPGFGRREPMSPLRRRAIKAVAYTLWGLAAFAVFFALGWIGNNMERLLRQGLAAQDLVQVAYAGLRLEPGLPPRLELDSCALTDRAGKPVATLENLALWPALGGLLAGRIGVGFSADACDGRLQGTMGTGSFNLRRLRLALDAAGVNLAKIPSLAALVPQAGGQLDLRLTCSAPLDGSQRLDLDEMGGVLQATVTGGRMKNLLPLFKVKTLELDRTDLDLEFSGNRVNLGRLSVESKVLSGRLDGTLGVDWARLGNTRLELRGQVRPDPDLTVLGVLEPRAAKAIREGKPVSIEITKTLATAAIKMR